MPRDRTRATPPPEPTTKPRSQVMKDYTARQRLRGHVQVKLWVPEAMSEWMHTIADEARKMHEVGLDPTENLPPSILPQRGGQ